MEKEEDKINITVDMTLEEALETHIEPKVQTQTVTPYRESEQQRLLRRKFQEKQLKQSRNLLQLNVLEEGNTYHMEELYSYATKRKLKIHRAEGTPKYIKSLKFPILMESQTLYVINVTNYRKIKDLLPQIRIKGRVIVFTTDNAYIYKELSNLQIQGEAVVPFPKTETWLDKKKSCLRLLDSWLTHEEAEYGRGVKNKLAEFMIQDQEVWQVIRSHVQQMQTKMTEDSMKTLLQDKEYYTIKAWLEEVTKGYSKRKAIKMTHYFIEHRGYSPRWLMNKWREYVHDVLLVAESYRLGIVQPAQLDKEEILKRSNFLDYLNGLKLAEMKPSDIRTHLKFIQDTEYSHLVAVSKIVYDYAEHIKDKQGVYLAMERIRLLVEQTNQKPKWGV